MKGYIGVTSREWFMYLSNENHFGEVNFWRKNTNNFKLLTMGEPLFFIVKNEKGVKGERAVLGKAKPISEMAENEETKVEDIVLVCSNCHRMLHRKRPWLTINELKELLVQK